MRLTFPIVVVAGCLLLAPAAQASVPAPELTTATLIELIRAHHPDALTADGDIEVAKTAWLSAERYPNPQIAYDVFFHGSGEDIVDGSQHSVVIEQPIMVGGQASARRGVARALERHAHAGKRLVVADAVAHGRHLLAKLAAAQARVVAIEGVMSRAEEVRERVDARHAAGAAARFDVVRIAHEIASMNAELEEARAETQEAAAELAVFLGLPGWMPRAAEPLAPLAVATEGVDEAVLAQVPEAEVLDAEVEVATSQIGLERAERWPDVAVRGGILASTGPYGLAPYLGVSVDLMIFDTGKDKIAEAEAIRRREEIRRDAIRAQIRARLEATRQRVERARGLLESYEERVVPGIAEARALVRDAWEGRAADLMDILDVIRQELEIEERRIELTLGVIEAELEWLTAIGQTDRL